MIRKAFSPLLSRCTPYWGGRGWGNPHLPRNLTPRSHPLHTGKRVWRTEEGSAMSGRELGKDRVMGMGGQQGKPGGWRRKASGIWARLGLRGLGTSGASNLAVSPTPPNPHPHPNRNSRNPPQAVPHSPPSPCLAVGDRSRLTTSRCGHSHEAMGGRGRRDERQP